MGKYWISSPIVLVNPSGNVIGRVVAKRKRADTWNIICYGGDKEIYLLCLKVEDGSKFPWYKVFNSVISAAEEKIGKVNIEFKPIERREFDLPEKGFKLLELEEGELWVRRSRKKRIYTLCICNNYGITRCLRYLRHEHVDLLYWLAKNRDRIGITNLLRDLGVQVNYKVARDEGEKEEAIIEDEGYGGLVQEKIEDGDIWSILSDALEDGDIERAKLILNTPEEARELGVSEDIIEWVFGEEEEEDEENWEEWGRT